MYFKGNIRADIIVWIIEDNAPYRESLRNLIEEHKEFTNTLVFGSCEDALTELQNSKDPPSVILSDIGLPGMSGVEGVRKFKTISPSTHLLMLTIYDDNNTVFEALCAGASGYLLKDSNPMEIIDSIQEVVDGGAPMNMHIARRVVNMFKQFNYPPKDYGLTVREKEILDLLVNGMNKNQIAESLIVSFHTINTHVKNIYEKLQVNTRSGLVFKALKEKLT